MNDNIFAPNFNITPRISAVLDVIDRDKWLIDNMLLMPKYQVWIRREISVQRAAGTTRIEGADMDESGVSKLARDGVQGTPTGHELANINALNAYEFIDYLSDQLDVPIDELAIRELDRIFIRGASSQLTPGVYRKGQNRVGNFTPPDQGDVPILVRAFCNWLQSDDDLNPILKAGIAHIHMVAIHPFWDGNGRTARGLSTLILQRSQFNFRKLLSLDWDMSQDRDRYFNAIERTLGSRFLLDYDATPWLEYFTSTLLSSVTRLVHRLTDWHRSITKIHEDLRDTDISDRQIDGLIFALHTGQITRADYIEIAGVSPITATRDLARLARGKLLVAEGKTRSRVYRLSKSLIPNNSEPPPESSDWRQPNLIPEDE